jgi:hypothetical protein
MTTIFFAYAYSFSFLYVLSSRNVQKFDFDLQVLYFTTTKEAVGEKKIHVWFYVKGYSKWEKVY